ncbi:hypothetical protein J3F84DRAFT_304969 [Trichoderma pleuroticola]
MVSGRSTVHTNIIQHCAYTCHASSISTSSNAREQTDMPSAADLTAGPPYSCTSQSNPAISMLCGINKAKRREARKLSLRRNKPLAPPACACASWHLPFVASSRKGAKIHRATPTGQPNTEH